MMKYVQGEKPFNSWEADTVHSEAKFSISHLGIAEMTGFFKEFKIEIEAENDDFSDAKINASIQIKSIDTRNKDRDEHLLATDFFDARQFPIGMILGKRLLNIGHGNYTFEADVIIKEVCRPVLFDLFYNGKAENPLSQTVTAGFSLAGSINRKDFGIGIEIPNALLSDRVSIEFNGEFIKIS